MYVLAKFQLRILKVFEVIALQSSSNRKIYLFNFIFISLVKRQGHTEG